MAYNNLPVANMPQPVGGKNLGMPIQGPEQYPQTQPQYQQFPTAQAPLYQAGPAPQVQAPQLGQTQYAQGPQGSNPYLGGQTQQSQVSSNPYAGASNPYLQGQINQAQEDATRGFNTSVVPQLDRMAQQSGSFGNTGVQQMQGQAYADQGRNLGNIANSMRMQDYGLQAQLGESAANRNTSNSQFNSGLNAGDLNRNMSGFLQGQGLDAQTSMFNAGQGNQMNQFGANLGFNTNALNANLGSQMGMFNAGQGNQMGQFNAGQWNQMQNAGLNRNMQMDQFNQNMDFSVDNNNWNRNRTGAQDQLNLIDRSMGWNKQGLDMMSQIQNMPLEYQQAFMNMASQAGGFGGSNSQTMPGNPWLGAIGGWQVGNSIANGRP